MKVIVNFSNILVAIILLLVGLAVLSILAALKILTVSSGPITIG